MTYYRVRRTVVEYVTVRAESPEAARIKAEWALEHSIMNNDSPIETLEVVDAWDKEDGA